MKSLEKLKSIITIPLYEVRALSYVSASDKYDEHVAYGWETRDVQRSELLGVFNDKELAEEFMKKEDKTIHKRFKGLERFGRIGLAAQQEIEIPQFHDYGEIVLAHKYKRNISEFTEEDGKVLWNRPGNLFPGKLENGKIHVRDTKDKNLPNLYVFYPEQFSAGQIQVKSFL